jgi:hypothetical protein
MKKLNVQTARKTQFLSHPDQFKDGQIWTFAKSYAKIAPHEYILEEQYPEYFETMKKLTEEQGKEEPFAIHGKTYPVRYYKDATHRYWVIDNVLNRCPKDQSQIALD